MRCQREQLGPLLLVRRFSFVAVSLTGTVDCILVFRMSGPFIESCHLSIKFNDFLDLETNGLVSLRDRILRKVAIGVKCVFRRGTAVFVIMVVFMAMIRQVATVTIIALLACLRIRTTASWRLTAREAAVVVVIYMV